ncbi:hypothetical protein, variant [Sphaeroforma arctica JP610]|uniref:HSF-type DNA-binding domain-containing protein n=1 Tax=Sphaeroforma arctica JP610 TaxID=667725 RepID=A0A0L0FLX6_9EUKA|nr:hypothetical protein, variant [Sphaeroforma arctica JP610]KNC77023.1 hypothetical protein, variant [Sphaeroforma arctica JP610]|eukprot:XP_014150925.1 hypothetical protein, variant [Sphaeroforma arctica JP610]
MFAAVTSQIYTYHTWKRVFIMSSASTFLQKLLTMIEDPKSDQHIAWTADGTSFIVFDSIIFSKEILPQYFRHNKFASFVRQLNMYDFHKIPIDCTTGIQYSENAVQFTNPYFLRGQPHLLQNMKRKAGTRVDKSDTSESEKEYIDAALANLAHSEHQLTGKLNSVESDNRYLREEFSKLCQKNTQQEQTVSRIMHFLTSIYGTAGEGAATLSTAHSVPNIQYPAHSSANSSLTFPTLDTRIDGDIFSPNSQGGHPQNWA